MTFYYLVSKNKSTNIKIKNKTNYFDILLFIIKKTKTNVKTKTRKQNKGCGSLRQVAEKEPETGKTRSVADAEGAIF